MGCFLYIVFGDGTPLDNERLAKLGLGHLPPNPGFRGVTDSPEQRPGTLICDSRVEPKRGRYVPAEQTWQKSINGKFWVGYWNDDRPTEKELRRASIFSSYKVELADGGTWAVPIARLFTGGTGLDEILQMGADGHLVHKPMRRFDAFCARVQTLWEDFRLELEEENPETTLDDDARWWVAAEALGLNYYVAADEINLLQLFSKKTMQQTLRAILDIPMLEAVTKQMDENKKKTTLPGHAVADHPDVAQGHAEN